MRFRPLALSVRFLAAAVALATLAVPTSAAPGQKAAKADKPAQCALAASGLGALATAQLCASAPLLGESLLVQALERMRERFANATEQLTLKADATRWTDRLTRCEADQACLATILRERRRGLEAQLQERAGPWPSAASWRQQDGACTTAGAPLPVQSAVAAFSFKEGAAVSGLFVQATECGRKAVQGYWHGALNGNLALVHDFLDAAQSPNALPSTWLVARYGGALLVEPVFGHSAFATLANARYSDVAVPPRAGSGAGLPTRPGRDLLEVAEAQLGERLLKNRVQVPQVRWPE